METHAFGFSLRANATDAQKRFPISCRRARISTGVSARLPQVTLHHSLRSRGPFDQEVHKMKNETPAEGKKTCFVVMGFGKKNGLRDRSCPRSRQGLTGTSSSPPSRRLGWNASGPTRSSTLGRLMCQCTSNCSTRTWSLPTSRPRTRTRTYRTGRAPRAQALHYRHHLRRRDQDLPLRREPRRHPAVSSYGRGH